MGLAFTKLFAKLFSKKEMRILMASALSISILFVQLREQVELLVINRSLASQAGLAISFNLQCSISSLLRPMLVALTNAVVVPA